MKSLYPLILFVLTWTSVSAQVGIGTTTPNPNAVLELKSPGNNQGFLVPRLTTAQRNALSLSSAESGLMVYDSDENKFYFWQATQWQPIRGGNDVALLAGAGINISGNTIAVVPDGDGDATNEIQDLQLNGNTLTITNNASATAIDLSAYQGVDTDNQTLSFNAATGALTIVDGNTVTVTPSGAAGGMLTGTYPNPGLSTSAATGNTIVAAVNNGSSAIQAARLQGTVVLETETPAAGAISGTFNTGLQVNDNAITGSKIVDGTVATADLADAAVSSGKIADGAITTIKVADGSITGAKVSDGSLTSADLNASGVTPGAYGTTSIVPRITVDAQGRITSVTNQTITGIAPSGAASGDLAGTYPNPTIAGTAGPNIITAVNNAATGTIAATRLQSTVVLESESPAAADISGNFVSGLSINANAVGTPEISDGAVTTAKVADLQITTAKIANSAITPIKIVPSTTPNQVLTTVAGATVWANLPAVSTGVTSIATGSALTGGPITATGTIDVATNGITATHLRSDAITDANRAVTSNHIRNGAVNDTKLSTTGVAANTYGSSTLIPVITVNAQGRVTGASTVAISGSSTEGLAETLAASPDAKGGTAHSLKSVSIGMTEGPSALNVNGSQSVSFREVSGSYTVAPDDYIIFNGPGKPATIELPKAGENPGRILIIRSTGTSTTDGILVNSAEGLDGFPQSEPLFMDPVFGNNTAYSITVLSTGTTWITIDRAIASTKQKG